MKSERLFADILGRCSASERKANTRMPSHVSPIGSRRDAVQMVEPVQCRGPPGLTRPDPTIAMCARKVGKIWRAVSYRLHLSLPTRQKIPREGRGHLVGRLIDARCPCVLAGLCPLFWQFWVRPRPVCLSVSLSVVWTACPVHHEMEHMHRNNIQSG